MTELNSTAERDHRLFGLSRNVFFLGIVSFLTYVSSEMIFTILPLYLRNVLRVGMPVIGLIEGIAESAASLLKVFSGWLSDRLGRRKPLAALGYGLSTLVKPFLCFASSWGLVLGVRFADRVGKGIRTSPRDALVADSTLPHEMGRSFGFHRALDTLGAVVGLGVAAGVVFFLQSGMVSVKLPSGVRLASLGPGMEFGEMAIIEHQRSADVWADTEVRCLELPLDAFADYRQLHPQISLKIMKILSALLARRLILANAKVDLLSAY